MLEMIGSLTGCEGLDAVTPRQTHARESTGKAGRVDCPWDRGDGLPKKEQALLGAAKGRVYMTVVMPSHLRDAVREAAKLEDLPPAAFVRMAVVQWISAQRQAQAKRMRNPIR